MIRPRETALVAAREVREAMRSRWFPLAAASFLVLSLALALLGFAGSERSGLAGFDRTTASVLNLALLFVPLVGLSLGALGVAGELEDGSLAALLAQPVTRDEVYAGKYAGLLAALSASLLAGFGATGVIVGSASGGGNAGAFAVVVGALLLLGAASLAIGTALSVGLGSRARVLGAAFAAWLVLVYLSDLGTIGLAVARNLEPRQVFVLALLNPVEDARVLGVLALTDRPELLGPVGVFGQDVLGARGLPLALVGALVLAVATPLALGRALFGKAVIT